MSDKGIDLHQSGNGEDSSFKGNRENIAWLWGIPSCSLFCIEFHQVAWHCIALDYVAQHCITIRWDALFYTECILLHHVWTAFHYVCYIAVNHIMSHITPFHRCAFHSILLISLLLYLRITSYSRTFICGQLRWMHTSFKSVHTNHGSTKLAWNAAELYQKGTIRYNNQGIWYHIRVISVYKEKRLIQVKTIEQ